MRSIFGLFTGVCIVSLCEVAYLRVIIIMYTSHHIDKQTKHRVPGLPMVEWMYCSKCGFKINFISSASTCKDFSLPQGNTSSCKENARK